MKADIDRLMPERGLDALIIYTEAAYNPALDYLMGNIRVTHGFAVKTAGNPPFFVANPMETDEAAATGFQVYSYNDFDYTEMVKDYDGDRDKAQMMLWPRALAKAGVKAGRIGVYGVGAVNEVLAFVDGLSDLAPGYTFVGEMGRTIFDEAAVTKDADEIERIKSVAQRTSEVLKATWDFIKRHQLEGETVVKADGTPLTIGEVKRFIRLELLNRDLEETGMIFSQGRDAGMPHSRGRESMPLMAGKSIVFDLFPREFGGGYFHDCTRTWCIGYAPDEVREIYDTVMDAFDISIEAYSLNKPTHLMQEAVLDYFEGKDHPTARSHPGTTDGYVHSLGHGVGLNIHESPSIRHTSKADKFEVGNFLTIEPGLYYPDREIGVRIEDAVYIAEDGSLVTLTDFHKELVIPMG